MQVIRIRSVNLNPNKQTWIALTAIYGIGPATGRDICRKLDIASFTKIKDLSDSQINDIRTIIDDMLLEGDLRKSIKTNIQNLVYMKSYRGNRHRHSLPCSGQNTRTNAATAKRRPPFKI